MIYKSVSEQETKEAAKAIIQKILEAKKTGPIFVGLIGDLGAGKTTFMKGVAEFFSVTEAIQSPTFVIQKIYPISEENRHEKHHTFTQLIHMDMYRLESEDALRALAWEDYKNNKEHILCVEWPNQLWETNPEEMIPVTIEHDDHETRIITYHE